MTIVELQEQGKYLVRIFHEKLLDVSAVVRFCQPLSIKLPNNHLQCPEEELTQKPKKLAKLTVEVHPQTLKLHRSAPLTRDCCASVLTRLRKKGNWVLRTIRSLLCHLTKIYVSFPGRGASPDPEKYTNTVIHVSCSKIKIKK